MAISLCVVLQKRHIISRTIVYSVRTDSYYSRMLSLIELTCYQEYAMLEAQCLCSLQIRYLE